MWLFIALALILLAAVVVLWPYLRRESELETELEPDSRLTELYYERDRLYQAIRDAQFDLEMGKLSQEDYQVQVARLKHRAAAVLRDIDQLEQQLFSPELDASLEEEIRRARVGANGKQRRIEEPLPATVPAAAANDQAASRFCGRCGAALKPGDRFCGQCGHAV